MIILVNKMTSVLKFTEKSVALSFDREREKKKHAKRMLNDFIELKR